MIKVPTSPAIRRFAVSHFLLESQFWFPIWLLFLTQKGFDLTTIVLVDGIFRLTMVSLEYPMGLFSDRLGRKNTYVLISIMATLTYTSIIFIHGQMMLFAVWMLWGLFWALSSGATSSYCYELIEHSSNKEEQSFEVFGFMRAISSFTALFSHLLAGFLFTIAPEWPFVISAIFSFLAIIIAYSLPETSSLQRIKNSLPETNTLKAFTLILQKNDIFLGVSLLMALSLIFFWSPRILFQPLFLELELSSNWVSIVYFLYSLAGVIAGLIAAPFRKKFGNQKIVLFGFLICWVGVLLTGLSPGFCALFFIPLMSLGYFISLTILEVLLHKQLENTYRAAMFSAINFAGGLIIMFTRPGLGLLADYEDSKFAFIVWGVFGVAIAVGFYLLIKKIPDSTPHKIKAQK